MVVDKRRRKRGVHFIYRLDTERHQETSFPLGLPDSLDFKIKMSQDWNQNQVDSSSWPSRFSSQDEPRRFEVS
jgi:hypothetical protein